MKRVGKHTFTLVELIIVILILGIIAAIAIPQFVSATSDAQEASLQANLAVMRNAINLYYHQHGATYPGAKKTDGTGTATVAADNPAAFADQLTLYTNAAGGTSASLDRTNYPYGPYVTNGITNNPVNSFTTVTVVTDAAALTAADIDGLTGWVFSVTTGEIRANATGYLNY